MVGKNTSIFGVTYYSLFDFGGKLFMNALMLVVVPLVCTSIISGMTHLKGSQSFGKIGLKTFVLFLISNVIAVFSAFLITNLFQHSIAESASHLRTLQLESMPLLPAAATQPHSLFDVFLQIIPPNIVKAFSEGQMLGLVFFSVFFGYVITKIDTLHGQLLQGFFKGCFEAMIQMTQIVMKFLPIGVFCLVAKQFAVTGWDSLQSLLLFFLVTISTLAIFAVIILPLALKFVAKVSPIRHTKAMFPALIAAFSTCSSSACLPVTMDCLEKRSGVSNQVSSLVLPLGLSLNMAGSAIYTFITVIFVMQLYGLPIPLSTQLLILIMTILLGLGEAGVPSASLIIIIAILKSLDLPLEGIALFLAIDRFLDMFRTTVNVFTNSCSAVIVAKLEGEKILTQNSNT
jgi:Na+/H+-dicarboxylate symporter